MGVKWYLLLSSLAFSWWLMMLSIFSCAYWSFVCLHCNNALGHKLTLKLNQSNCGSFFKKLKKFNWKIIALQNFAVFWQTSTQITHRYTYIPSLLNLHPISLPSHHSRLIQSLCLSFLSHTANSLWLSVLHMVMEASMLLFPYNSPSPPLSPCP